MISRQNSENPKKAYEKPKYRIIKENFAKLKNTTISSSNKNDKEK